MGRLKEESDQAGPGSVEQLRYRMLLSNINDTSGLWLRPSMSSKNQRLSNEEYKAACCKRNTIENPGIPKPNPRRGEDANSAFRCTCNGNTLYDVFGYHVSLSSVVKVSSYQPS